MINTHLTKKLFLIFLIFGIGIFIPLIFLTPSTDRSKPKTESVEIYKVVFKNGHVDTLKLKPPVEIDSWNVLVSDGNKVAISVSYFKKLN